MSDTLQVAAFAVAATMTIGVLFGLVVFATAIRYEIADRRQRRRALACREAWRLFYRQERDAQRAITPVTGDVSRAA